MSSMRFIDGVEASTETVVFTFEGQTITGQSGEAISSAIMRAGILPLRRTRIANDPRGYFCGMGLCWDCAVHVEGLGVVRSCASPVGNGQVISFADGRRDR